MSQNSKPSPKLSRADWNFVFFTAVTLVASILFTFKALAGESAKVVRLDDKTVATVYISGRGTVLEFPVKPTKVILGKNGSFGLEYVENDLAISPLSPSARSNLFVYLFGRRFSFDLVTSMTAGSAIVQVRDSAESKMKVDIHER